MAAPEPVVAPLQWLRAHSASGSVRSGTVAQVPAEKTQVRVPLTSVQVAPVGQSALEMQVPQLPAWLQARQVPAHALSQQTPSTQLRAPLTAPHSRLVVQGTPMARLPQYLNPELSPEVATHELFLHCVMPVQFTMHAVEVQAPDTQNWPVPQSDAAVQALVHLPPEQVRPTAQSAFTVQPLVHLPAMQYSNAAAHFPFTHGFPAQVELEVQAVAVSVTQSAEVVQLEAGKVTVGPVQ